MKDPTRLYDAALLLSKFFSIKLGRKELTLVMLCDTPTTVDTLAKVVRYPKAHVKAILNHTVRKGYLKSFTTDEGVTYSQTAKSVAMIRHALGGKG